MDTVISFFRDTLDGPFYIAWVIILVIFIFACIGYLAEKGINKKHERERYATVDESHSNASVVQDVVVANPAKNDEVVGSLSSNDINIDTSVNTSQIVSVPNNEEVVIPDVVATSVQNVNNVVIPSVNQDDNNLI
jgi:hypothetical protein